MTRNVIKTLSLHLLSHPTFVSSNASVILKNHIMFTQGTFSPQQIKSGQATRKAQKTYSKKELCLYIAGLN